ncbi:NFYB/HAP3 family transcription factor subunit [Candidatus Woesearchaeota archaeon]|nr:NFYB/HAP3 family transcription factor subunit [Candidatus Woesearchaeota archaeon]
MTRKTTTIPKAPMAKILAKVGAKRISDDSLAALSEILTDIGMQISEHAVKIAKHSGRKTVLENDIKLAAKQV